VLPAFAYKFFWLQVNPAAVNVPEQSAGKSVTKPQFAITGKLL
jgi:hypothetical protein